MLTKICTQCNDACPTWTMFWSVGRWRMEGAPKGPQMDRRRSLNIINPVAVGRGLSVRNRIANTFEIKEREGEGMINDATALRILQFVQY